MLGIPTEKQKTGLGLNFIWFTAWPIGAYEVQELFAWIELKAQFHFL